MYNTIGKIKLNWLINKNFDKFEELFVSTDVSEIYRFLKNIFEKYENIEIYV